MFVKFLSKTASLKLNYHKLNLINKFTTNSTQNKVSLSYDLNDKYNSDKSLVIAHGLFASKLSWRAIARRINDQTMQKVYTIDLRNHGNTLPYCESMSYPEMAEDLHNFVKTIVIEKDKCKSVSLLGHSMGGKTAMSLVLNDAQYIDKLIVADIAPSISPSILNIKSFLIKMNEIDMNSLNPSIFQARKQVEEKLCELPALKADYNQRQFLLTRLVEQNGKIKWHFNLPSIINHLDEIMSFPNFNTKFNKPTLFVGGELSNYITEKDVPSIEKYFTNYKIVKIPKAGHVIHFDNPTDTIKTIDEFINKNIF